MSEMEKCLLHSDQLKTIDSKVSIIYDALMGTLEKEGFISNTNSRLRELESFKTTQSWFAKVSLGGFITLVIGSLWLLLTGVTL